MGSDPTRTHAKGYLHPAYAASLSEFGTPRLLPASGGWVLERAIPGTASRDAMGCYPVFCCDNWTALADDLSTIEDQMVSLSLVADPFGQYSCELLRRAFPDVVRPFKEHYVVELGRVPRDFVTGHHLRNAKRGLRSLEIEVCREPAQLESEWTRLYDTLIARHGLLGLHRFSRFSFARQLRVPGCVALAARRDGEVVGMLLWYAQGDAAYYHLGAFSSAGYELRASFALFHAAIDYFEGTGCRRLSLGGGAGLRAEAGDGLGRFKRGWSTGTRIAYHCGRILNRRRYEELSKQCPHGGFFPVYRQDEFGSSAASLGEPGSIGQI